MWNAGLDEAQARIKISRRNINNLRYADDTTLMAESEEEIKSLLMKVKEKSEKVDLKLNIQKPKIIASSPITLWQIDKEKMETLADFFLGGDIKSLWTVTTTKKLEDICGLEENLNKPRQCIKKQRHNFAGKGPSIQSYDFSRSHVWT